MSKVVPESKLAKSSSGTLTPSGSVKLLADEKRKHGKQELAEGDQAMRQLFGYLSQHRVKFMLACFSSVTNKVLDLMPPILVGWVIDSVDRRPPEWIKSIINEDDSIELSVFLAVLAVVVFFFESLFEYFFQRLFMELAQDVQHRLRCDVYQHIQRREMKFFENHRLGETMAMLNDDVNQLERFLNTGFNEVLQLGVLFVFAGVVLFAVSWELALVGLCPIPFLIWGSLWYHKLVAPRYTRVRESVGALGSRLENNISGMVVIKSFNAEDFEMDRVRESSMEYRNANVHAIRLNALYVPVIRMLVAVGFGGVLLLGSYWVLENKDIISVGELVLFSMMVQRLLWPLTRMGVTLDNFERSRAAARRTFQLLHTSTSIKSPERPAVLPAAKGSDGLAVAFNKVTFGYGRGQPILRDLSFNISPGEFVGVAGTTGAGKSTLVKLLLRLYDVDDGAVELEGVDVRHLGLDDLREQIALVTQDVYLFHGTILENIAYGRPNVGLAEVVEAAQKASFHDFVDTLPDGYNTLVGERGIKLSGGQRQRLSIARAILKNAPILIFDEATSSVDTETERAIQENMEQFIKGKTAIVIAHRLSTIRAADKIVVLEQGTLVEQGTHEELLEAKGVYDNLWRIQSGATHVRQR